MSLYKETMPIGGELHQKEKILKAANLILSCKKKRSSQDNMPKTL